MSLEKWIRGLTTIAGQLPGAITAISKYDQFSLYQPAIYRGSAPILAFKTKMPRASAGESGGRDKVALQNGLTCGVESLSGQSAVLIDDVCTSGAHLMACADFLRARGAIVDTALCLARTVNAQHRTPLQVAPEDVEAQQGFFGL